MSHGKNVCQSSSSVPAVRPPPSLGLLVNPPKRQCLSRAQRSKGVSPVLPAINACRVSCKFVWAVTWSPPPHHFPASKEARICAWARRFEASHVVKENGKTGRHPHLHMQIGTSQKSNHLARSFRRACMDKTELTTSGGWKSRREWRCKEAKTLSYVVGWRNDYLKKDGTSSVLVDEGWNVQMIDSVKRDEIKRKSVRSHLAENDAKVLNALSAPYDILAYAKQRNVDIDGKVVFKEVCKMMVKDHYIFTKCWRDMASVFTHTMALQGDDRHFDALLERALFDF